MTAIFRRCGCRDDHGKTYGVLPVKNATAAQQARACPLMSTDTKHGTFSWRLSRGFDPATGKRIQINGGSFPTLKAAQVALNRARVQKDQGMLAKPAQVTLASYAAEWLPRRQTMGKHPLAPTTALNYKRYIDQDIAPARVGKVRLTEVGRADVQSCRDGLVKAGRGAVTVNRVLAVVMSILTSAVKDELVPVNVARGVEGPTVEKAAVTIWGHDELAAFLTVASEHRLGPAFELALHTALRRGELCGLRWQDIDLDRGVAKISNNRVKLDAKTIAKTTKTASSTAELELSPAAVAALEVWRLRQGFERDEWEKLGVPWVDSGYVLTMENGRPVDPAYLTRLFERLRTKTEEKLGVKLPRLTLHGLRHQAASMMWDASGDLFAVSKALRHSSPTVTAAVYTHMRAGKQRAVFGTIADALEDAGAHTLHAQALPGA